MKKIDITNTILGFEQEHNVKVVYLIKSGSQLYGTNTEASDTDYLGLFVPSKESVMLKEDPDHLVITTGKANSKNASTDIDVQLWSIYKFLNLVKKGETGALDLLFSFKGLNKDEIQVINHKKYTDVFLENFQQYLSKDLKAFVGYCLGQAKKYNIKGARYSELLDFYERFNQLRLPCTTDQKLVTLDKLIDEHIISKKYKYIKMVYAKGPKRQGNDYIWYIELLGRKHALDITISEFMTRIERLFNSFGARTLAASNGVDNKALSHATRVILECEELLETGGIVFPLKDKEFIKDIKYHKDLVQGGGFISEKIELNLDNLMNFLEVKLDKVNDLLETSSLPEAVPTEVIRQSIKRLMDIGD